VGYFLIGKKLELSQKQKEAFDGILHFLLNSKSLAYVFSGCAGVGKTTIIKKINDFVLNTLKTNVANVAFTGRASSIMRSKGIYNARTIHSFLYDTIIDEVTKEIIGFKKKKKESIQKYYSYIICDEASMVNKDLFKDLTDLEIPILFVGDKEQLPPVDTTGTNFNVMDSANIHLSEIHRQAEGNPIIALSRIIRETGEFPKNVSGSGVNFINRCDINRNFFQDNSDIDITLCGTNKVRINMNRLIRAQKGYDSEIAEIGETVMCLRNYYHDGKIFFNGERFKVISNGKKYSPTTNLYMLENIDYKVSEQQTIRIENESWFENKPQNYRHGYFTYAYASTVHKSQGGEFNKVLFIDDDVSYFIDQRKFRYTAVTRAIDGIIIAR
jgi:ATP-dependent exoDNAse (exonuclease V) alpha subunit